MSGYCFITAALYDLHNIHLNGYGHDEHDDDYGHEISFSHGHGGLGGLFGNLHLGDAHGIGQGIGYGNGHGIGHGIGHVSHRRRRKNRHRGGYGPNVKVVTIYQPSIASGEAACTARGGTCSNVCSTDYGNFL